MTNGRQVKRVLLALDAYWQSTDALVIAKTLAAGENAELVTLFVEDINLLNLAKLPFSKEVDLSFALTKNLDQQALERSFRNRVEKIMSQLQAEAKSLNLRLSSSVIRGNYLEEAFRALSEEDALLLNDRFRSFHAGPVIPKTAHHAKSLCLLFRDMQTNEKSLALSLKLAGQLNLQLLIILLSQDDQQIVALKKKILHSGLQSGQFRLVQAPQGKAENIHKLPLADYHCQLMVIPAGLDGEKEKLSQQLLSSCQGSVLLA